MAALAASAVNRVTFHCLAPPTVQPCSGLPVVQLRIGIVFRPVLCHSKHCIRTTRVPSHSLILPSIGLPYDASFYFWVTETNVLFKIPAYMRMIAYFLPLLAQQLPVTPLLSAAIRPPPHPTLPPPPPWGGLSLPLSVSGSLCAVKWRRHGELVRQ